MYYEIFRKPFKIWRSIKRKIKAAGFATYGAQQLPFGV